MSNHSSTLSVKGLGKAKLAAVARRAKHLGMTQQEYLRYLVDEDLEVSKKAGELSFKQLLGPGRSVDEGELDRHVNRAKARFRSRMARQG
jgi:hypothetical protein